MTFIVRKMSHEHHFLSEWLFNVDVFPSTFAHGHPAHSMISICRELTLTAMKPGVFQQGRMENMAVTQAEAGLTETLNLLLNVQEVSSAALKYTTFTLLLLFLVFRNRQTTTLRCSSSCSPWCWGVFTFSGTHASYNAEVAIVTSLF